MTNSFKTPILFITYNKIDTSKKILKVIKSVNPTNLIIASDGGKSKNESYEINKLRDYFNHELDDLNYKTIYNDKNLGCKRSVVNAIDKCFEFHDELIILEDDTLPSLKFFGFVEKILKLYRDNDNINLVSGYNYLAKTKTTQNFYFSKYTNIWGWGTWKNQWDNRIDLNSETLNSFKNSDLNNIFHSDYEKNYFLDRFDEVVYKNLDTWDYGLVFSNFYQKKLSIYPKYNLVKNIGLGHDKATHTNNYFKYLISTPNKKLSIFQSNQLGYIEPVVNSSVDEKFHKKIILKNSLYNRFVYRFLKLFRRI